MHAELGALVGIEAALERIDGSTSDQSRSDAASTVSMSDRSSGSASPSSKSPPLNQAIVSKPTRPPKAITRKSSPASSLNCAELASGTYTRRWPDGRTETVGEDEAGRAPVSGESSLTTRRPPRWRTLVNSPSCQRRRPCYAVGSASNDTPWPDEPRIRNE